MVASGLPNYLGCRILVRSNLNISYFNEAVVDYQDKDILDFLQFCFPIGELGLVPDNSPYANHTGAER